MDLLAGQRISREFFNEMQTACGCEVKGVDSTGLEATESVTVKLLFRQTALPFLGTEDVARSSFAGVKRVPRTSPLVKDTATSRELPKASLLGIQLCWI